MPRETNEPCARRLAPPSFRDAARAGEPGIPYPWLRRMDSGSSLTLGPE